jgi:hypothetical protein
MKVILLTMLAVALGLQAAFGVELPDTVRMLQGTKSILWQRLATVRSG